jgi:hypothetical protein
LSAATQNDAPGVLVRLRRTKTPESSKKVYTRFIEVRLKQIVHRVGQHFLQAFQRGKKLWLLSLTGSLALAYFAGTFLLTIPYGYYVPRKMVFALALVPFIFVGLSYLLGALFLSRWESIPKKNRLELLALSAVASAALFFIFPNPRPLLPQSHLLQLIASGQKNKQSAGSVVEVRQIRTLDGKDIPLDQLHRAGDWQLTAGELLSLNGGSESIAEMSGTISGGVIVSLRYLEDGGNVTIRWDGNDSVIDLYAYANGTIEEFVFEGLNWPQLTLLQTGLTVITYLLYFLSLFMVVFFFSFVIRSGLMHAKVVRILVILAYVICLAAFLQVKFSYIDFSGTRTSRDSQSYARSADLPLNSLAFWAGERPFTYPLVLKIFDVHPAVIWPRDASERVWQFQIWLSIASWGLLAWLVSSKVRQNWLKPLAFAGILFFSLSFEIGKWDSLMLSESISVSLFVLMIALWVGWPSFSSNKLGRLIPWLFLAALSAVTILYSFVRDSNPYFLVMAGAMFLLRIIFSKKGDPQKRTQLIYILVLILTVFLQNVSLTVGNRWQVFIYDHLAYRILRDDSARNFFAAHGLPVSDTLMSILTMPGYQYQEMIDSDPVMQPVKQWVEQSGKSTYFLYLLSNLGDSLAAPIRHASEMLDDRRVSYAYPKYPARPYTEQVNQISNAFYFRLPGLEWGAGIVLLAASIFWFLRRRTNSAWLVVAILALSMYPMMFLIWHGEPMEIGRHALQVSVQFRLAAWMALMLFIDAITIRVFAASTVDIKPQSH